MPNLNRGNHRASMLKKLQKEYENLDIKNKSNIYSRAKTETVWDRLSKAKRPAFLDGPTEPMRQPYHSKLHYNTARHPQKSHTTNGSHTVPNKRLTAAANTQKKSPTKLQAKKSFVIPAHKVETVVYLCDPTDTVKEVLARNACTNSTLQGNNVKLSYRKPAKSSYDLNQSPRTIFNRSRSTIISDISESNDNYAMPPLMACPTQESMTESAIITNNFVNLLEEKQREMEPDELQIIKNVVKTDDRSRSLQRDDGELFKDILKTQFQQILKQQRIVKLALNKLDAANGIETSSSSSVYTNNSVDVIKSWEQQTLKPQTTFNSIYPQLIERTANIGWSIPLYNATMKVQALGVRNCIELSQEFHIANRTLSELKEDDSRQFYLPLQEDSSQLTCTSFQKLSKYPDLLMRYLKPKNSVVPFNIMEQDAMFFNSYLAMNNTSQYQQPSNVAEKPRHDVIVVNQVSDESHFEHYPFEGPQLAAEPLIIEEIPNQNENHKKIGKVSTATKPKLCATSSNNAKSFSADEVQKLMIKSNAAKRSRTRINARSKVVAPKPNKNSQYTISDSSLSLNYELTFFKSMIVGIAQISIFLIMIIAITYPELKC